MFESITRHLPELQTDSFGKWNEQPKDADGTPEHPYQMPFVIYAKCVNDLHDDLFSFADDHPEFDTHHYDATLEANGLKWGTESMSKADVSDKDAKLILAMLVGAYHAERFCDGALLEFFENGSIAKWLSRLEELDRHHEGAHALFLRQKALLDQFLSTGAISKAQYDKSLHDLAEKMNEELPS